MKKKLLITSIFALLISMMSLCALAVERSRNVVIAQNSNNLISPYYNNTIKVQLDGKYLDFTDLQGNSVNPKIINNRTMVPMRKIFEELGMNISWNQDTKTVTAKNDEKTIILAINNNTAFVETFSTSGDTLKKEIKLDSAPTILNNRTMVPVRFIAESLNKTVDWDNENKTVIIIDFDKILNNFKTQVPELQQLFDLKIDPISSIESSSKVSGSYNFKNSTNKDLNEYIKLKGTADLKKSKQNEVEIQMNIDLSGKGSIIDSLKENNMNKITLKYIIADGKIYAMIPMQGENVWVDAGTIDTSTLPTENTSFNSYEDIIEYFQKSLNKLDIYSYEAINLLISYADKIFDKEIFSISTIGKNTTIKFKLDLNTFIKLFLTNLDVETKNTLKNNIKFGIFINDKYHDNKQDSADAKIDFYFKDPDSQNLMDIDFDVEMKVKSINKDFDIVLPNVNAMPLK